MFASEVEYKFYFQQTTGVEELESVVVFCSHFLSTQNVLGVQMLF